VRQYNNSGIRILTGDEIFPSSNVAVTITNNTVSNPGNINSDFNGILVTNGSVSATDDFNSCITISGNTLTGSGNGSIYPNNAHIRLNRRFATRVTLPGYGGAANADCSVLAFLGAANTVGARAGVAGDCSVGSPNPPTVNVAVSVSGTRGYDQSATA